MSHDFDWKDRQRDVLYQLEKETDPQGCQVHYDLGKLDQNASPDSEGMMD